MPSSGMLRHVALIRIEGLEEHSASIIRVMRIGELGTTLAVFSSQLALFASYCYVPNSLIHVTPKMEALCSFETLALTRATQCNIPENGILHSHHRENLKSYKAVSCLYLMLFSDLSVNFFL
jgi:hypothetical protein